MLIAIPLRVFCRCLLVTTIAIQLAGLPSAWAQRDLTDIPDPDPELERQTFILPDELEVNLFAADPMMAKPIQMNVDERGRLWVASSEVYPQIQPGQAANDKILILEDTDHDGQADKTTVFADGLLIPTGVIPGDGGAYVVNSTELLHLRDTDGDGKADERRIILSGFGTEDTHHLLHTLRWGHDGCLYMNQSIYIHSHVETPYGVQRLNGGGIWRFRPETMRLQVLCYGFVNPWGHHFDKWGQSFATDGAYHEGINYVFPGAVFVTAPGAERFVAGLNPGSPKHCGLEIVSGRHMPPDWVGSMITNDFRAHRVCRFVVTEDGSGYASRQEVEVIKSSHVAFRPIDVKMGPGGELYIADWYNPIIQHGEVDFRDPRRDHVRGRIWRITAKNRPFVRLPDYEQASIADLLDLLRQPEEWVRLHAKLTLKQRFLAEEMQPQLPDGDRLVGRIATATREWVARLDRQSPTFEHDRVEALWVLQNIGQVDGRLLGEVLQSADHRARAAAVRVATEWREQLPDVDRWLVAAVDDDHPRVRLEAVRALANVPSQRSAVAAARALDKSRDRFLEFAIWQTMRDLAPQWLPLVRSGKLQFEQVRHLLFALEAVNSPDVVAPLLDLIQRGQVSPEHSGEVLAMIAELGGAEDLSAVLDLIANPASPSPQAADLQAALLTALAETARVRKVLPAGDLARARSLLTSSDPAVQAAALRAVGAWKFRPLQDAVLSAARNRQMSEATRRAAMEALAAFGDEASIETLSQLAGGDEEISIRADAVHSLAGLTTGRAARFAVELLAQAPAGANVGSVLVGLLEQRNGPAALAAELQGQSLPTDLAKLAIRAVQTSGQPSPEVIEALRKAGKLEEIRWKYTPELVKQLVSEVASQGDPARGESVYRRAESQCLKCHAIGGAGGRVGPELVSLGATAQVDYLVEALLDPNAKLKENYHSKLIVTDDGRVISGIPIRESQTEVVLRDAEDREIVVAKPSIEEIKDGRSLMPDGIVDQLTRAELVDLLRFLSELGKVGDYAVGNVPVARRWQALAWTDEAHRRLNRTSHDTAATDDPALTWQSAYSTVAGELPLTDLPRFQPHKDTEPTSFVRCELDVTTPGDVVVKVNSIEGLALWLDGTPEPVHDELKLELARGVHTVTWDINHTLRRQPLRLELQPSSAQVQFVSGK